MGERLGDMKNKCSVIDTLIGRILEQKTDIHGKTGENTQIKVSSSVNTNVIFLVLTNISE